VVDDGSTDGSGDEARQIEKMRLIQFSPNRGTGAARKAGTRAARGRVVVLTDVDMTYPNDEIPRLVKELEGHDQVVGARTTEERTAKALRVPAKWFIRVAGNKLLVLFAAFQVFSIGLLADLVVRVNKPRDEADPTSL
jgi:glycosyltransferase involved in cell wall biosynthesis